MESFTCINVTRTVKDVVDRVKRNKIELSPPWQRNVVWNKDEKLDLISFMKAGYPLNDICIWVTGCEKSICVDGKNRLTAIFEYINGDIGDFKSLGEDQRERLLDYNIPTREFVGPQWTEKHILTYFSKIQNGKQLSWEEKLNAVDTEFMNIVKRVYANLRTDNKQFIDKFVKKKRMEHFRVLSNVLSLNSTIQSTRSDTSSEETARTSALLFTYVMSFDEEKLKEVTNTHFQDIITFVDTVIDLVSVIHKATDGWVWGLKDCSRGTRPTARSFLLIAYIVRYKKVYWTTADIVKTFTLLTDKHKKHDYRDANIRSFFKGKNERDQYTIETIRARCSVVFDLLNEFVRE